MKKLVQEQKQEVERAIVNRDRCRLRKQYQFLQLDKNVWFIMSVQERQKQLSRINSITLSEAQESCSPISPLKSTLVSPPLSVDTETIAKSVNLPLTCIEGIVNKASELVLKQDAIVLAPGQSAEARMVLSYSSKVPHMVTPTREGGFNCDNSCPNWKSLGLCSHTLAVAHVNGKVQEFVSNVKKKKKAPNVTSLVTTTMPKGRGRKGVIPPHKRNT